MQGRHKLLLGLFMLKMSSAMAAVLLDVEPIRVILLVFHRGVVASFAFTTS
jgi:hypothetical protein